MVVDLVKQAIMEEIERHRERLEADRSLTRIDVVVKLDYRTREPAVILLRTEGERLVGRARRSG
jgi:hypothetical protein